MGGPEIDRLAALLARLPGLGRRSARRAVLHLLKNRETLLGPLAAALDETAEAVRVCPICGNLDTVEPCSVCTDPRRDRSVLCVIEEVGDLWALERAGVFGGLYHVLGGTLSALDGVGPEDLRIADLVGRASDSSVEEVILATNATVDGQTTAHYVTDRLEDADVKVSRLALGVPLGGELDYLDEGTLGAALKARRAV
ncbi:MAG: recombination protein RecR [Rhodospirillales bacterium]|nr:recombination protein RecR [Rhodospirillales bacterium]